MIFSSYFYCVGALTNKFGTILVIMESERRQSHEFDELVTHESLSRHISEIRHPRYVNLILDHSAFVRGLGNIKRWFNRNYVNENISDPKEVIYLTIFIPSYTLHEFEYVKKGTSMQAINAKEAIRFIDKILDRDLNAHSVDDCPVFYDIVIESTMDSRPSWDKCLSYKVQTPKVADFPNYYENRISRTNNEENLKEAGAENIQDEDAPVDLPGRLKHLIRSCIQKDFIEGRGKRANRKEWKLVTEDATTSVWLTCYGVECMNVNAAEIFLFRNHNVNLLEQYDSSKNFNSEDSVPSNNILQNVVDTTLYSYSSYGERNGITFQKGNRKQRRPQKSDGIVAKKSTSDYGPRIKKEKFNAINYAPRGQGELWKP